MAFNIYDLSPIDPETFAGDTSDLESFEEGLSSGEVRQALLDRFREELLTESAYFVNYSFRDFDLQVSDDFIETPEGRRSALEDIENVLYDLDDSDISSTTWWFHNEIVYVEQEQD